MKTKRENTDLFAESGILAEKARRGERPDYSYTSQGIPELRAKSVPGWSPAVGWDPQPIYVEVDEKPARNFEGGILAEKVQRGEMSDYSYTSQGIPELRAKSVPGWSPAVGWDPQPIYVEVDEKPARKSARKQ